VWYSKKLERKLRFSITCWPNHSGKHWVHQKPRALQRRGGLGVDTPIFGDFLPRATIFLVLTAFNSVLPELVVLISTTNSGGTALNAADRILTRKVVARGSKIGVSTPSPPRLPLEGTKCGKVYRAAR
jgi:hypothetical protein